MLWFQVFLPLCLIFVNKNTLIKNNECPSLSSLHDTLIYLPIHYFVVLYGCIRNQIKFGPALWVKVTILKIPVNLSLSVSYFKAQKTNLFQWDAYLHLRLLVSTAHLYRKQPAWYLQHRSTTEIVREKFDVDGGWHEDETQVWAVSHQRAQDPKKEVTVEVSLMDLVHNHHLVLSQRPVLLDLSEQQPLSQEQQFGGCGPGGLKAYLVPHLQNITALCEQIYNQVSATNKWRQLEKICK